MEELVFDDIGSYPLPDGVSREFIHNSFERGEIERVAPIVRDVMLQKLSAGVELPNYPQLQDMNHQFLRYILDEKNIEPFLVSDAKVVEIDILEELAREYRKKHGREMKVRMCVTGPVELCYNQFGTNIYPDVLLNFARSINRIIKNSIHAGEMEIPAISIDEPSLGVVSLSLKEEEIKEALEIASSHIQKDVQIHLHSPLHYKLILPIKSINVIGVESASNPSYLNLIEKEKLEEYEKFLRVGISRTDIIKMAGEYERKYKVDPWKERKILDVVNEFESPLTISRRLEKAIEIFGGRIRYAGPDCGLGGWPSQDTAFQLLKNTSEGIKIFRESSKE